LPKDALPTENITEAQIVAVCAAAVSLRSKPQQVGKNRPSTGHPAALNGRAHGAHQQFRQTGSIPLARPRRPAYVSTTKQRFCAKSQSMWLWHLA